MVKVLSGVMLTGIILASAVTASGLSVYADGDQKARAESLVAIAERALSHVMSFRDRAVERGLNVATTNALITEAEGVVKEAKAALTNSEFQKAIEKAREALRTLMGAMRALGRGVVDETGPSIEALRSAITRAKARISRVKNVLAREKSPDSALVDEVNRLISNAEASLQEAEAALVASPAKIQEAVRALANAQSSISQAFRVLGRIGTSKLALHIESFVVAQEKSLQRAKNRVGELADRGVDVTSLNAKISEAEAALLDIRNMFDTITLRQLLEDLSKVAKLLSALLRDIAAAGARR